jgi:hypothetical protein
MNSLHVAKQECANAGMSGEEWLAKLYCQPKPFWHCIPFNMPPKDWLKAVEMLTGKSPSAAAKQLHRRVEIARAEFKRKQDAAWGEREVGTHVPPAYEKREASAWNAFNAQKQAYLQDYLRATKSGVLRRPRSRKCKMCNAAPVIGRTQYCGICRRQRNRESYRISKARKRSFQSKNSLLQPT